MTPKDLLDQIRSDIQALTRDLEHSTDVDLVDIGLALAGVGTAAAEALDGVKAILRTRAQDRLKHQPGSTVFLGVAGQATVTLPPPRMTVSNVSEIPELRSLLGSEFDAFFEEKTTYTPRKGVAQQILNLPAGPARTALLRAVVEQDQTPRVGFKGG